MTGSSGDAGSDVNSIQYETSSRESSQERKMMFEDLERCSLSNFNTPSGEELRERFHLEGRSFNAVVDAFNTDSRTSSQESLLQMTAAMFDGVHVSSWILS
jgi:hypothetical protein